MLKATAGLDVSIDSHLTRVNHAYTHFKVTLEVFICHFVGGLINLQGPIDSRWVRLADLDQYPLPKSNHKFIPLLKQRYADGRSPQKN